MLYVLERKLYKFFGILHGRRILLPGYLFIQSCIYICMDSEICIFYFTVESSATTFLLLNVIQLWPLAIISVGSGVLSTNHYRCSVLFYCFCFVLFEQTFIFWHLQDALGLYFLSLLRISVFFKEPCF